MVPWLQPDISKVRNICGFCRLLQSWLIRAMRNSPRAGPMIYSANQRVGMFCENVFCNANKWSNSCPKNREKFESSRATTLTAGIFLLREGWARHVGGNGGVQEVGCRHREEGCTTVVWVCVHKAKKRTSWTHLPGGNRIVGGWVAANRLPAAIRAPPAGENSTTHTHKRSMGTHTCWGLLQAPFYRLSVWRPPSFFGPLHCTTCQRGHM